MVISRLNLIYDFPFDCIKKFFGKFTETKISPNQYIYFNSSFFLTITCDIDRTIFEIQDTDLSFPSNKLNLSSFLLDQSFIDIPPDKFVIDFKYHKDIKLEGWSRTDDILYKGDFRLFKRCENTINFSTISVTNIFLDFKEFIQTLNNSFLN